MNPSLTQPLPQPASIAEITRNVVTHLGATRTAELLGVDRSTIHRWQTGRTVPLNATAESVLRSTFQALQLLLPVCADQTRSWMLTANPALDYRVPLDVLTQDAPAVLRAAAMVGNLVGAEGGA